MSFLNLLKGVGSALTKYQAPITGALSGVANILAQKQLAEETRKQVQEHNANLERSATKLSSLAGAEGTNQQMAYNWASNMIRKSRSQEAIQQAAMMANQRITDSSNKSLDLKTAAISQLAKKLAMPGSYNKKQAFKDFITGFAQGFGG